jgi:ribosomal protein L11 methyltransferase
MAEGYRRFFVMLAAADGEALEALSDALTELGALSVDFADAHEGTDREAPLFGEPGGDSDLAGQVWPELKLTALFAADTCVDTDAVAAALTEVELTSAISQDFLPEADWVRLTQAQFAPIEITPTLWIVPTWHAVTQVNAINIRLNPGVAFGTGSHPTTRLCLTWLVGAGLGGKTVLDYGTGSGILAIAAALLGAQTVVGVDIDREAVLAAQYNASENAVKVECLTADAPLSTVADVLVANILTNPLKVLAPLFARHVQPGGQIALSGVLVEQAEDVVATYAPFFEVALVDQREGWALLAGTRR